MTIVMMIVIMKMIVITIAVISIAPYLTDNGEQVHCALQDQQKCTD